MSDFFRLHVKRTKSFDARDVDESTAGRQIKEFAERSGVHPRTMGFAHLSCARASMRNQTIDEGAFADPRVPCQKGNLLGEQRRKLFHTLSVKRRELQHFVSNVAIDPREIV